MPVGSFVAPAAVPRVSPGAVWWRCECGHPLYEHSARVVTSRAGLTYYGCRTCECAGYLAETGQQFVDGTLSPPTAGAA